MTGAIFTMDARLFPGKTIFPGRLLAVFFWVLVAVLVSTPVRASETAVVKVRNLNLRAGPDQASTALAVLQKGARLPVVRRLDGWVEVTYGGRNGFLRHRARYVSIVADPSTSAVKTAANIEKIQKKAETIQRRIEASRAEVVTYTRQEADLIDSLDVLDRSLNQARAEVAATRRELETLDKQIFDADQAMAVTRDKERSLSAYASRRLVALYKLNWLGRINILASAESMSELFHRERALGRVLDHDDRVLQELLASRERLAALRNQQAGRRQAKGVLEAQLKERIGEMTQDRNRRSGILDGVQHQKSLELASIDSLRQAADQLNLKIQDLGRRLAQETARLTPRRAAKTPSGPAPEKGADKAATPGSTEAFVALKGLLKLPVSGKIISFFGPYRNPRFKVMNFSSGVDIRADLGEPVQAVHDGRILYSSWFKGYGNMLIVDHGGNYYSVYAHVEEMFKTKGAQVEAGEVIATVGDTGSLAGPKLHFEIRYHGKPLDPMEWIKKG